MGLNLSLRCKLCLASHEVLLQQIEGLIIQACESVGAGDAENELCALIKSLKEVELLCSMQDFLILGFRCLV
jgi:hypothetical protein